MQYRYAPKTPRLGQYKDTRGRRYDPSKWISGPDPLQHEMYYAWSKHRSQCLWRGEPYELTWPDWQAIFHDPQIFLNRGRRPNDLVLTRQDQELSWHKDNVEIITRLEQLRRTAQRRRGL